MKLNETNLTIAIIGFGAIAVGVSMLIGKAILAAAMMNIGFGAILLCLGTIALVIAVTLMT